MRIVTWLLVSVALPAWLTAAADNPFAGTWRLNVHKSNYAGNACPRSMTIEIEARGEGIRYHSETVQADGRKTQANYTADYGGAEAIVRGEAGLLAPVSLQRTGDRAVVA